MTILEEHSPRAATARRSVKPSDHLEATLHRVDRAAARASYLQKDELVILDAVIPPHWLADILREAEGLEGHVRRRRLPFYKKSGSVGYHRLRELAPRTIQLYQSPELIAFLGDLVGASLLPCPNDDPHACALYWYTEPGDRVGFHYDSSHYDGDRYTVLIGLVDRSTSRLVCRVRPADGTLPQELRVATSPGRMVVFNGSKLSHAVSPLGRDERRVVLTLEYVTSTRMSSVRRFVSNVKDAMAYFGFREVFGARAARI